MIHGEKISFKPTPNLELGFTRTTVFSGVGRANMTLGLLKRTYFSIGNGLTIAQQNDSNLIQIDPGDRHGGFDLSYRVPRLFNGLTFYTDSLAEDDPSPLANPQRAPFRSGIYIPQLPLVHKMDFRAEGVYTDAPNPETATAGFFIYWNTNYHDSYTNKKNVLGDWIGREGKGRAGVDHILGQFTEQHSIWLSQRKGLQGLYSTRRDLERRFRESRLVDR